jgi:hypothetical protein
LRCTRCGNENPGTNRFCGMCGAVLLPAPATPPQSTAVAPKPPVSAPAPPREIPRPTLDTRPVARIPEPEPVISGPSFLGLNRPAASSSAGRASLSIDPHTASASRDVGYLLDDEEPVRGGSGKYVFMLVALLLAAGLGYLRWKNHNFDFLTPGASKAPATVQPADTPDSAASTPSGNPTPSASTPPSTPLSGDAGTTPAQDAGPAPANPAANPPASNAAPAATTPSTAAKDPTASGTAPAPSTASAAVKPSSSKDDSDDSDTPDTGTAAKPQPAPSEASAKPAATKPTAAVRPSEDPVTEAQKYLYGRGVRQDCEQGLRLLKPAANRANPKAMIEMGALYSAGLCTPRDLPTAYRWFAMALHKDPDNQSVQNDLQKLWGEMTQPERQLAIKLSQ